MDEGVKVTPIELMTTGPAVFDRAAGDLRACLARLAAATQDAASCFVTVESAAAFSGVRQSVLRAGKNHAAHLTDLGEAVRASGAGYHTTDNAIAAAVGMQPR